MRLLTSREQKLERFRSRVAKWILIMGGGVSLLLFGLDVYFPPCLERFHQTSPLLYDKEGELLSVALSKDGYWRIKVSYKEVDPTFLKFLIHYEDKRFYFHPGIDPMAMGRALLQWMKARRVVSGGSTITLQTVRLLEPRKRSIFNKILECFRALQLEAHFTKNEILEMYLSLAPYGGNIEGIRAASLKYFGKEPNRLRLSEAALLVVMPQRPNHLRPELYPDRATKFRDKVLNRLADKHILSEKETNEAKEEKVPLKLIPFPRHAMHLLNRISSLSQFHNNIDTKNPGSHSTLQKSLQIQTEKLLKSELPFLESTQTIAVLIVENNTRSIRAYIGNADFFDENRHGQVNMIEHIRSPGSTLKPFIYGMGFDDGIIHPETILQDVPTIYGEYAPSNFKDIFHGEVTVREALQQSLNIPAITILDKIKPGRFMAHLQNCGIKMHLNHSVTKASLPIALGGVGISLKDLVCLYVSLANDGEISPIQLWKENVQDHFRHTLLSPYATWHINHILQGTNAPDGFVNGEITKGPIIAYKTGTSYGFRDAWAIGYTKDYTIGVWVGKPDGTPSLDQTGRQNAAPILFKVMRLLPMPTESLLSSNQPVHDLSLSTHLLPTSLRKFDFKPARKRIETNFYIQFPKDGMVVLAEKEANGADAYVSQIILKGGAPPYHVFSNGQIIAQNIRNNRISWKTSSLGFHELTVIDNSGHSENITIELVE